MALVTFYFQLHQPFRLHPDRSKFLWDDNNREIFEKVANKNYIPATKMFVELVANNPQFKITMSMSGTFLEQAKLYKPEVITLLQQLLDAGRANNQVEFLEETYYHSIVGLYDDPEKREFRNQVSQHRTEMEELFGVSPVCFRNTELMYNNEIAEVVADMGFKAMLCEKRDDMYKTQNGRSVSPNAVFRLPGSRLIVLPRNRELSDDIAYRFPHTPVSPRQYAHHLSQITGEMALLGFDYEHLGEHIWEDKGIFEFWKGLPQAIAEYDNLKICNPTEAAELFKDADCPAVNINGLSTSSWADAKRDTYGWLGNKTQQELFERIKKLEKKVRKSGGTLLTRWRHLTTSDQLYFIHESAGSDQEVHSYFSPYGSVGEAVRIITDKIWDLEKSIENFYILKKSERTPIIIISPETDRLPTEGMGEFAKYVSGKSGGMGEVVAALCRGFAENEILTYVITLNLKRKFMERANMTKQEYVDSTYRLPRENIKVVDSALFENHLNAYDGNPLVTAAEFQKQIRNTMIKEIISKHAGRGIIHTHDWMAGGIIPAYAKMRQIPLLHTVHNTHTGHIPVDMYYGVNLGEFWDDIYCSNVGGVKCVDCQATAIKNAAMVNYVGTRFLEEVAEDYFADRHFIPPGVRQETKAKLKYGSICAIPNGISPTMYSENQPEDPDAGKPGLAKRFSIDDDVILAKKINLLKFQKQMGLLANENAILFYWPSRLDETQKGIELLENIAMRFVIANPDTQIAIVGNTVGTDRTHAEILGRIACSSGGKIAYKPFNEELSMLGYAAASDVFGASLYEPFGQIDVIGNLFGATATNRDTGGFHDKIVPLRLKKLGAPADTGNGVIFKDYSGDGLWWGLNTALQNHRYFRNDPQEWERQAKRIMKETKNKWGLNSMITGYLSVYEKMLGYRTF
ncbi:MAG TPA: hypothetical protein DDW84_01565 [Phycisphaerales bacterium]|nr:hypothetical protein [Phycisphaerales bacterium]HBR19132.1 hypothetical protein [Phycisphaerales bacterium]